MRVPVVEETCPTEVCFDILVDSLKQVNSFDKEENVSQKKNKIKRNLANRKEGKEYHDFREQKPTDKK